MYPCFSLCFFYVILDPQWSKKQRSNSSEWMKIHLLSATQLLYWVKQDQLLQTSTYRDNMATYKSKIPQCKGKTNGQTLVQHIINIVKKKKTEQENTVWQKPTTLDSGPGVGGKADKTVGETTRDAEMFDQLEREQSVSLRRRRRGGHLGSLSLKEAQKRKKHWW